MADYETNRVTHAASADIVDAGLRKYMLRVYNYMLMALIVTGITAYGVYLASVTTDPASAVGQFSNGVMVTEFGRLLFGSPLKWAFMFGPLVVSLFIYGRIRSVSLGGAQMWFWFFSILIGTSLSTIFIFYNLGSIVEVFFITAAAFGGLSLFGYTTKRDLSGIGAFLVMGVWGLIIAGIVNVFLNSDMIQWITSIVGIGVFAGLTAYYNQTIKEMYYEGDGDAVAGKKAILGALALYISFINMFQYLLALMGGSRR